MNLYPRIIVLHKSCDVNISGGWEEGGAPTQDDEFSLAVRRNPYIISKSQSIENRNISFFFRNTEAFRGNGWLKGSFVGREGREGSLTLCALVVN